MNRVARELDKLPPIKRYQPQPLTFEQLAQIQKSRNDYKIEKHDDVFVIEAPWLARILGSVNINDYESLQYFQRVLASSGISDELERMGIEDGDTVCIYEYEFEYFS